MKAPRRHGKRAKTTSNGAAEFSLSSDALSAVLGDEANVMLAPFDPARGGHRS